MEYRMSNILYYPRQDIIERASLAETTAVSRDGEHSNCNWAGIGGREKQQ